MISIDLSTISEVLSHYPVGRLERAESVDEGLTNDNFFIDTETGRYFLRRRSPIFSPESIDFELHLIEHLVRVGFPTPPLIRSTSGSLRVDVGGRHWELYEYIPGERFDPSNLNQTRSAAHLLAWFHRAAIDCRAGAGSISERRISLDVADDLIEAFGTELKSRKGLVGRILAPAAVRLMRAEAGRTWECMRSLEGCPMVTVHGDFQPSNIIFRGDTAACLLDFGLASVFYRVYDVANSLLRFSALKEDYEGQSDLLPHMDMIRFRAFSDAYQEEMPLDEVERRVVPALIRAIYFYDLVFFMGKEESSLRQALWLIHAARFLRWLDGSHDDINRALG